MVAAHQPYPCLTLALLQIAADAVAMQILAYAV